MPAINDSARSLTGRISEGNPDISAVILVDTDGRVHASHAADARLVQVATAIVVPLRDMLDRAAAELGCGAMVDTFITGEHSCFAVADVDGSRSVIVVGSATASPGALRSDARFVAQGVRVGEAFS